MVRQTKSKRLKLSLIGLVLVALLIAAGCGKSNDEGNESNESNAGTSENATASSASGEVSVAEDVQAYNESLYGSYAEIMKAVNTMTDAGDATPEEQLAAIDGDISKLNGLLSESTAYQANTQELQQHHDAITAGLQGYSTGLNGLKDALASGDEMKQVEAVFNLFEPLEALATAEENYRTFAKANGVEPELVVDHPAPAAEE
ncbi:hypothetical protein [Cohnella sp. GCM10027633]|uniref:hypothetical protein n=1 Tax=unclassified Cohnella TaxID=2636738 RepID=UPI0036289A15